MDGMGTGLDILLGDGFCSEIGFCRDKHRRYLQIVGLRVLVHSAFSKWLLSMLMVSPVRIGLFFSKWPFHGGSSQFVSGQ